MFCIPVSSSSEFKVNITSEPPFWPRLPKKWTHGLIGCIFGNLAVCSPNSNRMFIPVLGHERASLLREDFRFATDDPICQPQLYIRGMLYMACMRAPSLQADINYLFRPFQTIWWIPCPGVGNLGRLESLFRKELVKKSHDYLLSLEEVKKDITRGVYVVHNVKSVDEVFSPDVLKLYFGLQHAWGAIAKPGTLNDIRLRYVNFQHQEIMLRARIDEILKFRSCFVVAGPNYRENGDKRYMGAQTPNMNTALALYNAGLPVWYICEAKNVDPTKFKHFLSEDEVNRMRGVNEIPPIEYQMGQYERAPDLDFLTGGQYFISRVPTPKAVVVWRGQAGDPRRYSAMIAVLGSFICGWETEGVQGTLASSPQRLVEPEFSLPPPSNNPPSSNDPPSSNVPPSLLSSSTSTSTSSSATPSSSTSVSGG